MGRKSEVHTRHQPVLCFETSPTYIAEMERKQRVRAKLGSGKVQQEHKTAMCFTPIEKRVHCPTLTPKDFAICCRAGSTVVIIQEICLILDIYLDI